MKVVWSPLALERVEEIADHIAVDNVDAARVFLIDIFAAVGRLRTFSQSGRIVPEVNRSDIREIIFKKKYRVAYRIARQQVSILRFDTVNRDYLWKRLNSGMLVPYPTD